MRSLLVVGAGLALLLAAPAQGAELCARLLLRGEPAPGAEIELQVELSWDGRPERLAPSVPTVTIPEGAGLRLGRTGSRFDGTRSTWWTNGTITLPDHAGPYALGPATIPAITATGTTMEFVAAPRTLGAASRSSLLGPGLAGGLVLGLVLGLLARSWSRLLAEEQIPLPSAEPARAVRAALEAGEDEAALTAGLALHAALARDEVAREYLGDAAPLEEARQALRFGGARPDPETTRALLAPLLAIAAALE